MYESTSTFNAAGCLKYNIFKQEIAGPCKIKDTGVHGGYAAVAPAIAVLASE